MPITAPDEDTVPTAGVADDHVPPDTPGVMLTDEPTHAEGTDGVSVVPEVTVIVCVAAA